MASPGRPHPEETLTRWFLPGLFPTSKGLGPQGVGDVLRKVTCRPHPVPRFRAAPGFTGQSWCLEPSRPRAHGLPVACLCLPRPLPWCLCLQKNKTRCDLFLKIR